MIKPDPTTLKLVKFNETENADRICKWMCTRCHWEGEIVAARKCRDEEKTDGVDYTVETFCPECLAEASYVYNN